MNDLIGLDWGTSSLRAYWIEAGAIRETRGRPWGLRHLPPGGFEQALAEVTAGWPALPRLACGMVGSRSGWLEVPYLELPAAAEDLGRQLGQLSTADGRTLWIVPGLHNRQGPDVMRGEETQLLGAVACMPALAVSATVLMPGTHSKWASVREGRVVDFCTRMTGELYAVLCAHSILGVGVESAPDPQAFLRGVRRARDSGAAGALGALFSARSLMLEGELPARSVPDYLSGLLLGEELRSIVAEGRFALEAPVQLIGEAALCDRYARAAAVFDLTLAPPLADAAAHGLWQIALRVDLSLNFKDTASC